MFNTNKKNTNKKRTGLESVKVLAINPDIKWLVENNFRKEGTTEEPDYTYEYSDNSGNIIDVYVEGLNHKDMRGNIRFKISSEPKITRDGSKTYYVDNMGNGVFATSIKEAKYVNNDGIAANQDLQNLVKFLRTWTRKGFEEALEVDLEAIKNGDISKLKEMVKMAEEANKKISENEVPIGAKVLFGVNDKGYTVIYNKDFIRIDGTAYGRFIKSLKDPYKEFKADYGGTLEIKEYKPSAKSLRVDTDEAESEDNNKNEEFSDIEDLPF